MVWDGVVFRTFAPKARKVSLLLEGTELPMQSIYDGNFYEITLPKAKVGQLYEYRIYFQTGGYQDHCDPYGFQMELRPKHKSIICDLASYTFQDQKWMKKRSDCRDKPLNIYELHLGSWKKKKEGDVLSYVEIAKQLVPYLKEAGYNYIEVLPISEHPCDESWGYQNTGFFAPTSRYGTPTELMKMIDVLHQNDIGIILDFVPVHFAIDPYALAQYDGTHLYEYPHSAVGVSEWGSYNFMHSRGEVRSFLQSAANYWLKYYHFDGLRIDALSRIIYWQGDEKRGENGNAIQFIKVMNLGLKERHKGIMLIAEDSTNYEGTTKSIGKDGLGFDYKWNMRKYPAHDSFYRFMRELNEIYLTHPALSEWDYREDGFTWIDCHKEEACAYVISRRNAKEELIVLFNFSDREQTYIPSEKYAKKKYEVLLHTNWEKYGGDRPVGKNVVEGKNVVLGRFSGVLLRAEQEI